MSLARENACTFGDVSNVLTARHLHVGTLSLASLDVVGDVDVGGNVTVDGDMDVSGNLSVSNNVDVGGNFSVTGVVATLHMDAAHNATITNLPAVPALNTDAASKAYVDSKIVFTDTLPLTIAPEKIVLLTTVPHGTAYRGVTSGESTVLPAGTPWPVKQYKEFTGSIVFGYDGANAVFDATKWCNFQVAVNDFGGTAGVSLAAGAPLPTLTLWSGDELLLNFHELIDSTVAPLNLTPTPRMEASITPLNLNATLARAAFYKSGTTYDFQIQFSAFDAVSVPTHALPLYFSFKLYMPR